jgi:hypothetical protein
MAIDFLLTGDPVPLTTNSPSDSTSSRSGSKLAKRRSEIESGRGAAGETCGALAMLELPLPVPSLRTATDGEEMTALAGESEGGSW